ncbi:UNVERIFIED_CONTAM: serine/alanine racemase [Acetivibrio alkalicellulosi]
MRQDKGYRGIDYFRIIAAFLVIAIHTSPLLSINETSNFVMTRIISRVAVPFFFMATGFFLFDIKEERIFAKRDSINRFIIKALKLYGVAILVYLPINIYGGYFRNEGLLVNLFKDLLFNGTLYHLWYLPASITGVLIVYALSKKMRKKALVCVAILLYIVGLLGDSYYGIVNEVPLLKSYYGFLFNFFDFTRNGIFFTPLFIVMGALIQKQNQQSNKNKHILGLVIVIVLFLTEGLLLNHFKFQRHDSMYFMLVPCMYFLFQILLLWRGTNNKNLRTMSMTMYIIHPLGIILIRGIAKILNLQIFLIENSLIHYIAVCIFSFIVSIILAKLLLKLRKERTLCSERAWIEINTNNLRHNVNVLKELLHKECRLMAVVKANAYGHGDVEISKELNRAGVKDFAVATIQEGIGLRKKGVKGNILILGYTHPNDIKYLVKYRLTQTVLHYKYARILNKSMKNIKVHIKIDTGMNRLGESCQNLSNIEKIYQCEHLIIEGMYTHLCVSDSLSQSDTEFSLSQIDSFFKVTREIKNMGYNIGKIHIQSSYGVLNFPQLKCDYARIGIALYGVLSKEDDETRINPDLRPVLSVKARIIMTKAIEKGQWVGYGREFAATQNMKIAVVSIGYADGIPRNISNGFVVLKGCKKPIISKICMDQMIIDITDIPNVKSGDIVTIIGEDGERITSEEIARSSGTITNELLSRLGSRLERKSI